MFLHLIPWLGNFLLLFGLIEEEQEHEFIFYDGGDQFILTFSELR